MVAAVEAGADAVDAAIDSMSGSTSQPSLGALVAALRGTKHDTGLDLRQLASLNEYWDECRALYSPFESGQLTGDSDVVSHEMPGGQYTVRGMRAERARNRADNACIRHRRESHRPRRTCCIRASSWDWQGSGVR